MNRRILYNQVQEALSDTPVVFLRGARQTGKTTLVKQFSDQIDGLVPRRYISLDTATVLASALSDPTGFLYGFTSGDAHIPVTIDEAQRAPQLMLAIKEHVDKHRQAGQFLLTGSANILALPNIADSLAGRMEVLTLYPLSQEEITGIYKDFIASLFQKDFFVQQIKVDALSKKNLLQAMTLGGYPEVLSRPRSARRAAWFESYITTLIERDVRDMANIQDIHVLLRLLHLLGARSGTLYNQAEISRSTNITATTLGRYIALFESLFLVWFLPAWSTNLSKRLVKSPKVHISDVGLACHLCGADEDRLAEDGLLAGRLFESFIAGELQKQNSWTNHPIRLYHYRTQQGVEVDFILEDRRGHISAIEVKLSSTVTPRDCKGMISLRDALHERFICGVVLYTGQEVIPLGDRMFAVPIQVLLGKMSIV